jgi:trimethylamine--corrinoid protein Co-methyltransferase
MRMRAHDQWKQMLSEYSPPAMDEALLEALTDFVDRRKSELPDAWY